jgi:hypothetical protein
VCLALLAAGAHAQQLTVTGRLLRGGPDGTPLAGHWAVLHRVGATAGGPVDSVRTDAAGRYTLRLEAVDSSALYLVSADYAGLGYFSAPVPVDLGPRSEVEPLLVYDTTSAGPPIVLHRRLVTIGLPAENGAREVLELLELRNPGSRTRVAPDSTRAVWGGPLPAAALQFRVGESDMSPGAVLRVGDRVAVFAPLSPERVHQLTYQYYLPGALRSVALPLDGPVTEFNLLVEDTAAAVTGTDLVVLGTRPIEGRRFAAFRADSVAPGTVVTVAFSATPFRVDRLVPWIAGAAALVLAWGLVVAFRRARVPEDQAAA